MAKIGVIVLNSGREVQITYIRQHFTYSMIEGLPTDQMNQKLVDRLMKEEREKGWWAGEPHLIPAPVRPLKYEGEYPFGKPEAFPPVTCIARLKSATPARDSKKDMSELTVIWFQNDYAFPIDPQVLDQLRGMDWDAKAIDHEV